MRKKSLTCLVSALMSLGAAGSLAAVPDDVFWDNRIAPTWSDTYGPHITAITEFEGELVIGGVFTIAGDTPIRSIAAWNGSSWSSLGNGMPGVAALAVFDGQLIAGAGHSVEAWDGGSWSALGGLTDYPVSALLTFDDRLIVGTGDFWGCGLCDPGPCCGANSSVLAWDSGGWSPIGPGIGGLLTGLAVYDDRLMMSRMYGYGSSVGDISVWDGSAWSSLHALSGGVVHGSTVYDGRLLVAVRITLYTPWGVISWSAIEAWDGESWSTLDNDIGGTVVALTVHNNKLIAGGSFTAIGGVPANHIAAWDGTSWAPLGSGTDGPVHKLAVYDGKLVVTGDFDVAGGQVSPSIALWTKPDPRPVVLDVMPGSCSNPVRAGGAGSGVLPVAILGTDSLGVREIDPASVTLNGASPIRWSYEDVGAPPVPSTEVCACSAATTDGQEDLILTFSRDAIVAAVGQDGMLQADGLLDDGSPIVGVDCVTLVGGR